MPTRPRLIRTIRITKIAYDAPGADRRSNANREYLQLKNTGSRAVTLTGWTIRDAGGTTYRLSATRLGAGRTLTLHTGKGAATSSHRYWNRSRHVWNNTGKESAQIRDSFGRSVAECAWTSRPGGYVLCWPKVTPQVRVRSTFT